MRSRIIHGPWEWCIYLWLIVYGKLVSKCTPYMDSMGLDLPPAWDAIVSIVANDWRPGWGVDPSYISVAQFFEGLRLIYFFGCKNKSLKLSPTCQTVWSFGQTSRGSPPTTQIHEITTTVGSGHCPGSYLVKKFSGWSPHPVNHHLLLMEEILHQLRMLIGSVSN